MANTSSSSASAEAAPESLQEYEARQIDIRRGAAWGTDPETGKPREADLPRVGLALSGGGIRSATFCLGLLRGLAQNDLLKRIDYLSTVSGGGFVGAMLGRLISRVGLPEAQQALAHGRSLLMWWLRSNGRYLTPAGSRDIGMALATYVRAWLAMQLEFAMVCLLLAMLIVAPHVLQEATHVLSVADGDWPAAIVPWWPMAIAWLAFTLPYAIAPYWIVRDPPMQPPDDGVDQRSKEKKVSQDSPPRSYKLWIWRLLALAVSLVLVGVIVVCQPSPRPGVTILMLLIVAGLVTGIIATWWRLPAPLASDRSLQAARLRNELTRALRWAGLVGLVLLGFGVLDWASWGVLRWLGRDEHQENWVLSGAGVWGLVLLLLRAFAEPLQKIGTAAEGRSMRNWGPQLLNLFGIAAGVLLFFLWLIAVQWFVFDNPWPAPPQIRATWAPAVVLTVALFWALGTGWLSDAANASSLHSFYRARLTRSYLSIGNPKRGMEAPASLATGEAIQRLQPVTEVIEGDDTSLLHYADSHARGAPVHLINACLNQTLDDRSGLYNADRKGQMLTVSSWGFELGLDRAIGFKQTRYDPGTLGRWVAISGAAVATGAGSFTSRGWAAMMFLLGIRLGYWIKAPGGGSATGYDDKWTWRQLVKQAMLQAEAMATFRGLARPWWYLSDGGHFENTGVYPLLRRELDFIVVADCGADPRFEFNDLENLIRKARIDFDADIAFYTKEDAQALLAENAQALTVLSPEDIANNYSARGVLLARITYHRSDPTCQRAGTLLIVKPNLHETLDADVLAYASRNPEFPQQSTGDQFFDEAQWESYQRLGEDFGRAMTPAWLACLPGWNRRALRSTGAVTPMKNPQKAVAAEVPAWRQTAKAAAVGTTIGLGAFATAALGVWQVLDQWGKANVELERKLTAASEKSVTALAMLTAQPPEMTGDTQILARQALDLRRETKLSAQSRDALDQAIVAMNKRCSSLASVQDSTLQPLRIFCGDWTARGSGKDSGGLAYWTRPTPEPVVTRERRTAQSAVPGSKALPVPGRAPSSVLPPADVRDSASAAVATACVKTRLFVQIYDEERRPAISEFLARLEKSGFKGAQGIENVTATADAMGGRRPIPWPWPTLIVHDVASLECVDALMAAIEQDGRLGGSAQIKPLPIQFKPRPGVIELWLPPMK
jgi:predicted acylesterase/phospholipase RssA